MGVAAVSDAATQTEIPIDPVYTENRARKLAIQTAKYVVWNWGMPALSAGVVGAIGALYQSRQIISYFSSVKAADKSKIIKWACID